MQAHRASKFADAKQYAHLYNSRQWRAKRAGQLRNEPLCALCKQLGRTSIATVADHVVPHKGDVNLFWNGELQSLCKICHDGAKKEFEQSGQMRGCDVNGNPLGNGWGRERIGSSERTGEVKNPRATCAVQRS